VIGEGVFSGAFDRMYEECKHCSKVGEDYIECILLLCMVLGSLGSIMFLFSSINFSTVLHSLFLT
jgi:hypothetical protein